MAPGLEEAVLPRQRPPAPGLRFGFGAAPQDAYLPERRRTDRLSLVWWEHSLDDPSPMFTGSTAEPATIVAVWPTDEQGYVLNLDPTTVRVAWWTLTPDDFQALRALHVSFPLGQHDVWVAGGRQTKLNPCPKSLWRHSLRSLPQIHQAVWRQVLQLES